LNYDDSVENQVAEREDATEPPLFGRIAYREHACVLVGSLVRIDTLRGSELKSLTHTIAISTIVINKEV